MEEILVVILRLAHILFGVIWVGFGILAAWVMMPVAKRMGEDGLIMLRTFFGHSMFNRIMPVAAIITTVAGLILWPLRTQSGIDFLGFTSTGDIVMVIGSVFGLLAFGHGITTGRYAGAFAEAAKAYAQEASDANRKAVDEAMRKISMNGNISAILTLIAVIGMSSARYLG